MAGVNIIDFAKAAEQYGWKVGENPNVGTGRVGKHAPGSYHYSGKALDITAPTNVDVAPAFPGGKPISWQQRTGELTYRLKQLAKSTPGLTEVLGQGDPGHSTHVHVAVDKLANLTPQQLQWGFTGRTKDASGKLTDVMPGAQLSAPQQQTSVPTPAGNIYNFYLQGKKKEDEDMASLLPNPTDFLTGYINKPSVNSLAALKAAFNSGGELMT
jgi:hypothetical protein